MAGGSCITDQGVMWQESEDIIDIFITNLTPIRVKIMQITQRETKKPWQKYGTALFLYQKKYTADGKQLFFEIKWYYQYKSKSFPQ